MDSGEVSVPLLEGIGHQKLSTTLGYRVTDNNVFGSDETWKLTLDWEMVDDVRFRGGYQHAVRSPNITELFAPQVNNFPTFTNQDPCNTTGPNASNPEFGRSGPNGAAVQALCAAQSAVAGGPNYVQPFGQATAITGGNPNLKPEQADSWTFGVVWDQVFNVERLSVSIDYFTIDLEDVIEAVNATTIVQRCFNRDGANPTYSLNNSWCDLFNREPSNGGVIDLQQLSQNQAFIKTSGIDLTFNWGLPVGPGDLGFQMITSWLDKFETQTTNVDPVYDFAGTVSNITAGSAPEWKSNLVTTYAWENVRDS